MFLTTEVSMEILENRHQWLAEYRAGWLSHLNRTGEFDWKRYNRPTNRQVPAGPGVDLRKARLMLVSSAGSYLLGTQKPFDAAHPLGDYSIRVYPSSTRLGDLAFAHDHFDHAAVNQDPQVLVPLQHLEQLVIEGYIGELSSSVVSFMGYQPDVTRILDETIPLVLSVARAERASAALLIPT
jgi:hypothetical protein